MAQSPKLIASYFTIAGDLPFPDGPFASPVSLRARAEAAAQAGYVGMGLYTDDLVHNLDLHGYEG